METFKTRNFIITCEAVEEYESLANCFPEESTQQIAGWCRAIDNGNMIFCTMKVSLSTVHGEELAADYLGCCLYRSVGEFVNNRDYYSDMVRTVIAETRELWQSRECVRLKAA